ncbi:spore coat protein [Alkaliphilus sp. MSJ-5]|uniref:Spore coat protein n=1 Tax=Alkaliphilus flagellatus TaxID=2841507 RepID=A0ABS6G7F1_9FIRM|nr:spore coat protein [Alkaliphilus flagellatus]MBU5678034.1 spore coat protein [Alkaliphilus flagellatus]
MNYSQEINTQRCDDLISIGATCVAQIEGRFFWLIEVEMDVMGKLREEVIIREITATQATVLIATGVMRCQIVDTLPTSIPGIEEEPICAFVVGQNVFLVFSVENATDRLVLVRVPLCRII